MSLTRPPRVFCTLLNTSQSHTELRLMIPLERGRGEGGRGREGEREGEGGGGRGREREGEERGGEGERREGERERKERGGEGGREQGRQNVRERGRKCEAKSHCLQLHTDTLTSACRSSLPLVPFERATSLLETRTLRQSPGGGVVRHRWGRSLHTPCHTRG